MREVHLENVCSFACQATRIRYAVYTCTRAISALFTPALRDLTAAGAEDETSNGLYFSYNASWSTYLDLPNL